MGFFFNSKAQAAPRPIKSQSLWEAQVLKPQCVLKPPGEFKVQISLGTPEAENSKEATLAKVVREGFSEEVTHE